MGEPINPISGRLRRLQEILEGTDRGASTRMALRLGISKTRWGNVLHGYTLSIRLANRICARCPGISLDWLYHGRTEGLSAGMFQRLELSQTPLS